MGKWTCQQCGTGFDRERSGSRPIRFCSQPCYHAWNRANGAGGGQFRQGLVPWNKGVKGLRFSPATEWKKGQRSRNWLPVGSETIRKDKNGKLRAYIKLTEPNVWKERAILVWETANELLPAGMVVHHKDRNTLNDAPENLEALSRPEHIREHRTELQAAKAEKAERQPSLLDEVA